MKIILIGSILLSVQIALSQVIDRSVTVENADTSGKVSAAQMADQASLKMAEDLVIEYVGADSYARNKAALTAKVIRNASKFTPFQKALELERGPFGVRQTIQYKVNLTEFRKLLADAGTFSKTRLAHQIVSFLTVEDESGNRIAVSWKKNDQPESMELIREWNEDFKKVFEKAGYTYNKNLNPAWMETFSENSSAQDVLNKSTLPQSFLLWGTAKIVVNPANNEKTLMIQTKFFSQDHKREVSDSARRFNLKDDAHAKFEIWGQDLVAQLDEVDVKSLSQQPLLKIVVIGAIPLTEQDQFKQLLANSSTLIKTISERRFESHQITYEIETDATSESLAQKLKSLEWKGKRMKSEYSPNEIRLEIL